MHGGAGVVRWRKRAGFGSASVRGVGGVRGVEMLAGLGRSRIAWPWISELVVRLGGGWGCCPFPLPQLVCSFNLIAVLGGVAG